MHLWLELLASALLAAVVAILHSAALYVAVRHLGLRRSELLAGEMGWKSAAQIALLVAWLLVVHAVEIGLYAGFYVVAGAVKTVRDGIDLSASTYATLALDRGAFGQTWRLVPAFEGVAGLLMIGWSAAAIATAADRLIRET